MILFSPSSRTAVSISSSVGQQVTEPQFAVLEHLLDLLGVVFRTEAEIADADPRLVAVYVVPGVEGGAQGRACVARRGLHEHVLPAPALLERRNQEGIMSQPARQAKVAPAARHAHDGLLHGAL
jgi:hypothetical protein